VIKHVLQYNRFLISQLVFLSAAKTLAYCSICLTCGTPCAGMPIQRAPGIVLYQVKGT